MRWDVATRPSFYYLLLVTNDTDQVGSERYVGLSHFGKILGMGSPTATDSSRCDEPIR
jgi:hypothetical protein